MSEAARLLRIEARKLRRWLEGAVIAGRPYEPVIREKSTGSDVVTWGEFVEAGFLNEYRLRRVTLQHMRPLIEALRVDLGVRYPLAQFQPAVDTAKQELVFRAQERVSLDESLFLIRRHGGVPGMWQMQWAEPMRKFLDKVYFDTEGVARRMFPLGQQVPVIIDPEVQFGIPQVGGIRTEVIAEAYAEMGDERQIAEIWGLKIEDVKAALRWEVHKAA